MTINLTGQSYCGGCGRSVAAAGGTAAQASEQTYDGAWLCAGCVLNRDWTGWTLIGRGDPMPTARPVLRVLDGDALRQVRYAVRGSDALDADGLCTCPAAARVKHVPARVPGCTYAREGAPLTIARAGMLVGHGDAPHDAPHDGVTEIVRADTGAVLATLGAGWQAETLTIAVGFTVTDRHAGYIPTLDGYRDGSPQTVVSIHVPAEDALTNVDWAEAVFVATNAPDDVIADLPAARAVRRALAGRPGVRALQIGDTVTVAGLRYVCDRAGWTRR